MTTLTAAGRAFLAASGRARSRKAKTKAERRELIHKVEMLKARAGGQQVAIVNRILKQREQPIDERAGNRRRENTMADLTWHREVALNISRDKRQR